MQINNTDNKKLYYQYLSLLFNS